jgi:hypothetical protein
MLHRTFDAAVRAARVRPYFWARADLAPALRDALPAPWFEAEAVAGLYDGEPAVCFKHPARSDVARGVVDRLPVHGDDELT